MGIGDNLIASGMAKGAFARGKKIAFGDGTRIKWDQFSEMIFQRNPNVVPPGHEHRFKNVEWINFYKGHRIYNRQGPGCWIWNYEFQPIPGEIYFSREEVKFAEQFGREFIVIEPNIPAFKAVAQNKQWPVDRYEEVARRLSDAGFQVVQFEHGGKHALQSASRIATRTFRHAAAVLANASLYIGPEGGLHHAAAAVSIPAVVLFGGFIPPQVTGYKTHTNLTGGAEACGRFNYCEHCQAAMNAISVEEVQSAAVRYLEKVAA